MSREEQTVNNRKRCILYLIEKYLLDMGFQASANELRNEAYLQNDYEICDNIDLDTIYLEYCSYYHLKFGKYPKMLKHIEKNDKSATHKKLSNTKKSSQLKKFTQEVPVVAETNSNDKNDNNKNREVLANDLKVLGLSSIKNQCNNDSCSGVRNSQNLNEYEVDMHIDQFLFNAECNFTSEWKEFAKVICRDLVKQDFNLKWENICGHNEAIDLLKESIIFPLEYPEYFTGVLKPWKAILLHGPPGTGKTLLARTVCSETFKRVSFFNVRSSSIISKWRGDSEKLIRVLFEVAKYYAPSIIFFDEVDGITSRRDGGTEHEASKRFKNELLSLMDNIENGNKGIFILASTNIPWDIDAAFLRRFERKILISLPNLENRKKLIKMFLPNLEKLTDNVLNNLAVKCDNFTGDEIRTACKEATMKQIRVIHKKAVNKGNKPNLHVTEADLLQSFDQIQPLGQKLLNKHIDWSKQYGNKL